MPRSQKTLYELLGVPADATETQIQAATRQHLLRLEEPIGPSESEQPLHVQRQALHLACKILCHPGDRLAYDLRLAQKSTGTPPLSIVTEPASTPFWWVFLKPSFSRMLLLLVLAGLLAALFWANLTQGWQGRRDAVLRGELEAAYGAQVKNHEEAVRLERERREEAAAQWRVQQAAAQQQRQQAESERQQQRVAQANERAAQRVSTELAASARAAELRDLGPPPPGYQPRPPP